MQPFVSVCTPTFNRRPFIPSMIKCFEHQTYPKDKIEWLILDDGTDKIGELVSHIPQVKYLKYDEKMTLGKKRNILNQKSSGDIIIFIDDDDYYPPERISHAVETLQQNPKALCAGSSKMFIYFKHINKMLQFGPYGPNHATAATFAFKRELLSRTKFDEKSSVAEEKNFLKDYTIPFAQLDPMKTILVFSHNHNSFDKKELLTQGPNPNINETHLTPTDFVKEPELLKFFINDIEDLLNAYEPGKPENKPDVVKQLKEIKATREKMNNDYVQNMQTLNRIQSMINNSGQPHIENNIEQQKQVIEQLLMENTQLKNQVNYLENKIKQLISEKIQQKTIDITISEKQVAPLIENK